MVTDPIADMLTRLRNAAMARQKSTEVPLSKMKRALAEILKSEGFIEDFRVEAGTPGTITVFMRYGRDQVPAFVGIKRSSRPGRRFYVGHDKIPRVHNGLGVAILSTSSGLMTGHTAREKRIGGELLCEVW